MLTPNMDVHCYSNSRPRPEFNQRAKNGSDEMLISGGAGIATFGALRNSSRIGNSLVSAVKTSKTIKATKQAQILKLLGKFKPLSKYVNTPIVKGVAGGLAGMSALVGLAGSFAKISDTCSFLQGKSA